MNTSRLLALAVALLVGVLLFRAVEQNQDKTKLGEIPVLSEKVEDHRESDKDAARNVDARLVIGVHAEQELALLRTHTRTIKRTESHADWSGNTCVVIDSVQPPDQIRREVIRGSVGNKHTVVLVVNGDQGWSSSSDGITRDMEASEIRWFLKSLCELPEPEDLDLKVLLPGMSDVGDGKLDGRSMIIVKGKDRDGLPYKVFFDKETRLPVKREYQRKRTRDGEKEDCTALIEYKEIDGLRYAFRKVELVEGKTDARTEVEVKLVSKFAEETFEKPQVARGDQFNFSPTGGGPFPSFSGDSRPEFPPGFYGPNSGTGYSIFKLTPGFYPPDGMRHRPPDLPQ